MNTQLEKPEALLALADRIEEAQGKPIAIDPQAAAELRRLHALNQALLGACKKALYALDLRGVYALDLRDAIAKAE